MTKEPKPFTKEASEYWKASDFDESFMDDVPEIILHDFDPWSMPAMSPVFKRALEEKRKVGRDEYIDACCKDENGEYSLFGEFKSPSRSAFLKTLSEQATPCL